MYRASYGTVMGAIEITYTHISIRPDDNNMEYHLIAVLVHVCYPVKV